MPYPDVFQGFASVSHEKWTEFSLLAFKPKPWTEDDVDIEISHCGVCGSDVHMISGVSISCLSSRPSLRTYLPSQPTTYSTSDTKAHTQGWKIPEYPLVVGHEVCGTVKRVGRNVNGLSVGDRVGCGAQIGSCGTCTSCTSGHENYCKGGFVDTYDGYWPGDETRTRTQGGYANYIRVNGHFCFRIPVSHFLAPNAWLQFMGRNTNLLTGRTPLRRSSTDAMWRSDGFCTTGSERLWSGQEGWDCRDRRPRTLCGAVRGRAGCRGLCSFA